MRLAPVPPMICWFSVSTGPDEPGNDKKFISLQGSLKFQIKDLPSAKIKSGRDPH